MPSSKNPSSFSALIQTIAETLTTHDTFTPYYHPFATENEAKSTRYSLYAYRSALRYQSFYRKPKQKTLTKAETQKQAKLTPEERVLNESLEETLYKRYTTQLMFMEEMELTLCPTTEATFFPPDIIASHPFSLKITFKNTPSSIKADAVDFALKIRSLNKQMPVAAAKQSLNQPHISLTDFYTPPYEAGMLSPDHPAYFYLSNKYAFPLGRNFAKVEHRPYHASWADLSADGFLPDIDRFDLTLTEPNNETPKDNQ